MYSVFLVHPYKSYFCCTTNLSMIFTESSEAMYYSSIRIMQLQVAIVTNASHTCKLRITNRVLIEMSMHTVIVHAYTPQ